MLDRPVEAEYGPVGCFHDAVFAEVLAPALEASVADPLFRPHLSLGYFREPHDPKPLREVTLPLRDSTLGSGLVREVHRVLVPIAKSRLLEPWSVLETVALGGAAGSNSQRRGDYAVEAASTRSRKAGGSIAGNR